MTEKKQAGTLAAAMGRGDGGRSKKEDEEELRASKRGYKEALSEGNREEEARWANIIGDIHKRRGEYVKALSWLRTDYEVSVKHLPQRHLLPSCFKLMDVLFCRLLQDAGITDLTQFAWGLVNDTYKMDLILIYPPYMIALACIYIASVLKDKDTTSWFEELRADMNIVKNISMEILDFYDTYKIDPQRGLPEDKISPVMNKLPAKA